MTIFDFCFVESFINLQTDENVEKRTVFNQTSTFALEDVKTSRSRAKILKFNAWFFRKRSFVHGRVMRNFNRFLWSTDGEGRHSRRGQIVFSSPERLSPFDTLQTAASSLRQDGSALSWEKSDHHRGTRNFVLVEKSVVHCRLIFHFLLVYRSCNHLPLSGEAAKNQQSSRRQERCVLSRQFKSSCVVVMAMTETVNAGCPGKWSPSLVCRTSIESFIEESNS